MNKQPLTGEQSGALDEARQLFVRWRKNKTGRPRIPDNLWQAAVDLYHTQGITINRIARGLRLNHTALKEKIFDIHSAAIDPPADEESDMFIEVQLPPDHPPEYSNCVIEMENHTGLKMRICFNGRADPAVISLGKYLLAGGQ